MKTEEEIRAELEHTERIVTFGNTEGYYHDGYIEALKWVLELQNDD